MFSACRLTAGDSLGISFDLGQSSRLERPVNLTDHHEKVDLNFFLVSFSFHRSSWLNCKLSLQVFSGRLLIGQNDSLDVLLFDENLKSFEMTRPTILFWLTSMDINRNAFGDESLKPCCSCSMKSFIIYVRRKIIIYNQYQQHGTPPPLHSSIKQSRVLHSV